MPGTLFEAFPWLPTWIRELRTTAARLRQRAFVILGTYLMLLHLRPHIADFSELLACQDPEATEGENAAATHDRLGRGRARPDECGLLTPHSSSACAGASRRRTPFFRAGLPKFFLGAFGESGGSGEHRPLLWRSIPPAGGAKLSHRKDAGQLLAENRCSRGGRKSGFPVTGRSCRIRPDGR